MISQLHDFAEQKQELRKAYEEKMKAWQVLPTPKTDRDLT